MGLLSNSGSPDFKKIVSTKEGTSTVAVNWYDRDFEIEGVFTSAIFAPHAITTRQTDTVLAGKRSIGSIHLKMTRITAPSVVGLARTLLNVQNDRAEVQIHTATIGEKDFTDEQNIVRGNVDTLLVKTEDLSTGGTNHYYIAGAFQEFPRA